MNCSINDACEARNDTKPSHRCGSLFTFFFGNGKHENKDGIIVIVLFFFSSEEDSNFGIFFGQKLFLKV